MVECDAADQGLLNSDVQIQPVRNHFQHTGGLSDNLRADSIPGERDDRGHQPVARCSNCVMASWCFSKKPS